MSPMVYGVLNRGLAMVLCGLCWGSLPGAALANTPEQWIELGCQVHGHFGSSIALGIRIGLDARERLNAEPRALAVTYGFVAQIVRPSPETPAMQGFLNKVF